MRDPVQTLSLPPVGGVLVPFAGFPGKARILAACALLLPTLGGTPAWAEDGYGAISGRTLGGRLCATPFGASDGAPRLTLTVASDGAAQELADDAGADQALPGVPAAPCLVANMDDGVLPAEWSEWSGWAPFSGDGVVAVGAGNVEDAAAPRTDPRTGGPVPETQAMSVMPPASGWPAAWATGTASPPTASSSSPGAGGASANQAAGSAGADKATGTRTGTDDGNGNGAPSDSIALPVVAGSTVPASPSQSTQASGQSPPRANAVTIPEPATLALLGGAMLALGLLGRRER